MLEASIADITRVLGQMDAGVATGATGWEKRRSDASSSSARGVSGGGVSAGGAGGSNATPPEGDPDPRKGERKTTGQHKADFRSVKEKLSGKAQTPDQPHGIYEDAGYHHHQSKGLKSPNPTNGQKALDKSVEFSKTSSNRVGVDPDTKEYVEFFRTGKTNIFHGVKTSWDKLTPSQRFALFREKLVRSAKKGGIFE